MSKLFKKSYYERFRLLLNRITIPKSTTKLLVISILALTSALVYTALDFNADLNGDTVVNSLDISELASCFKQNPISNRAFIHADVDNDGDIDQDDFNFVSTRIGEVYYERLFFSPGDSRYGRLIGNEELNGDGALDLVTTAGGVSILLGNGNGGFQTPQRCGFFPTSFYQCHHSASFN
jgi:hypothetical protein